MTTDKLRNASSKVPVLCLGSVLFYGIFALALCDGDTWNHNPVQNVMAAIGLILMVIGSLILLLSVVFRHNGSLHRIIQLAGAIFLMIGSVAYLIPTVKIMISVLKDSCLNNTSDVPCYYESYYGSILEFIPIRAFILALFVFLNMTVYTRLLVFGCDFAVTGGYMISFFINWYKQQSGDNNTDWIVFKCMMFGWGLLVILPFVGLFVYACWLRGRVNKSGKQLAIAACVVIMIGGCTIAGGIVFGTMKGAFDSDFFDNGLLFSILVFGISILPGCASYAATLVYAVWSYGDDNQNSKVEMDDLESQLETGLANGNGEDSTVGKLSYVKLSAVV